MKRMSIVLITLFVLFSSLLTAEFKPYGSTRIGFWYENEDEEWSSFGESELSLNYFLQSNSRFGAKFEHGDLTGRVEFGGTGSIRLLYGEYKMSGWSLLIGQANTGVEQKAKQTWGADKDLIGWGAIDESRKQQVRLKLDSGPYLAFLRPEVINAEGASQDTKVILPKINLGYNGQLGEDISFKGTLGLNHYTYNDNTGPLDHTVMSYILGLLFDFDLDPLKVTAHFNYGRNTKNYGLSSATSNGAIYDSGKDEIVDVTTLGGFGQISYKLAANSLFTSGVGYVSSDSDAFDNSDSAMAAFVQLEQRLHRNLRITPEIGLLNKMKDIYDTDEGSMIYFGTQLRMDF